MQTASQFAAAKRPAMPLMAPVERKQRSQPPTA